MSDELNQNTPTGQEPTEYESVFFTLLPYLVGTLVLSCLLIVALLKYSPLITASVEPRVVTFDSIKYINAQRAIMSKYLKGTEETAPEVINQLSERSKKAISKIAGPNTLVVLRQAVVQGDTHDITDEVLKELGLPVDVPTNVQVEFTLNGPQTALSTPVKELEVPKVPGEKMVTEDALP